MKRFLVITSLCVGLSLLIGLSSRGVAASSSIVISEVMTGDTTSSGKEFIELFNMGDQTIQLSGWVIEYKSATGKTWSKRASADDSLSLDSHSYIVFSTDAQDATHLTTGMAQTGGNLRVRDGLGNVVDQFAWGDGDSAENTAAPSAALGQSIARNLDDSTGLLVDSDNNDADFHLSTSLTPGTSPADEAEPSSDDSVAPDPTTTNDVIITELLPDPQTPLSDSTDEFIELYNNGNTTVQLGGWSLRDKSAHIYKLAPYELAPHQFYVLKSATTKISLNNDGDEISLLDTAGQLVDISANYGNAKPGFSWGLTDGGWAWLTEPTPGASNAEAISIEATPATTKKTSTKKKAAPKVKKAAKAKAAKKTSKLAKATNISPFTNPVTNPVQNSRLRSWLLIGLGAGTIGYGIYAYRPEITHYIHQLRTKFRAW